VEKGFRVKFPTDLGEGQYVIADGVNTTLLSQSSEGGYTYYETDKGWVCQKDYSFDYGSSKEEAKINLQSKIEGQRKTVNTEYILSLKPCEDRLLNYLQHYTDFSGTVVDFLELDKISIKDKIWVVTRNYEILSEKNTLQFIKQCVTGIVSTCSVKNLKDFYDTTIQLLESHNGSFKNPKYLSCKNEAYRAAYQTANSAVYGAIELLSDITPYKIMLQLPIRDEDSQLSILKNILNKAV
jgi:hypothetical protein